MLSGIEIPLIVLQLECPNDIISLITVFDLWNERERERESFLKYYWRMSSLE